LRNRATADHSAAVRGTVIVGPSPAGPTRTHCHSLRDRATNDDNADVRRWAIQAVVNGWADDPGTLSWLRCRATADDRADVRGTAMLALAGWADDLGALQWLHNRATFDDSADVRRCAIQAIVNGWADDPDALPWLRGRATTDDGAAGRGAAVQVVAAGWAEDPGNLQWLRERCACRILHPPWSGALQSLAQSWRLLAHVSSLRIAVGHCAMMPPHAAATGLPRHHQRVRAAAATAAH
jgi:HEAT repeat protein